MSDNGTRMALLGLDPRSAQALQMAVTRHVPSHFVLCDEGDTQVIVADLDNGSVLEEYEALQRRWPDIPVLSRLHTEARSAGPWYLSKPVSVKKPPRLLRI